MKISYHLPKKVLGIFRSVMLTTSYIKSLKPSTSGWKLCGRRPYSNAYWKEFQAASNRILKLCHNSQTT